MKGSVKWFNTAKGFGFIKTENGEDIFVHKSDVGDLQLDEGMEVEFELGKGPKGSKAVQIRLSQ